MKKIIIILLVILLLYIAIDLYGEQIKDKVSVFWNKEPAMSDEEQIKQRIDEFLFCYNSGDFEGLLECFDKKTRNTYKSALRIAEGAVGTLTGCSVNYSDFFSMGVGTASVDKLLTIEISDIYVEDDIAMVYAEMTYNDSYSSATDEIVINLKREKREWYISKMLNKNGQDVLW